MDAVNHEATWNEALGRLIAYLTEMEIGGIEHRTRVALRLLDQARSTVREAHPVEHTMSVAQGELIAWFGEALGSANIPAHRKLAWGLVAWRMADGPARWPDAMLETAPTEEIKQTLAEVSLRSSPDLEVSRMVSRDMDYGAMETLAQETWHQFAWAPLLRAAALWTVIFFVALYVYDRLFP